MGGINKQDFFLKTPMENMNSFFGVYSYPFGMIMPGRNEQAGDGYRYGYNGMEMDNEVSGNGNSYTTQFRQYDPRLGRWKSLDPLMAKFPHQSPYVAFDNNPIFYKDPKGKESEKSNTPKPKKAEKLIRRLSTLRNFRPNHFINKIRINILKKRLRISSPKDNGNKQPSKKAVFGNKDGSKPDRSSQTSRVSTRRDFNDGPRPQKVGYRAVLVDDKGNYVPIDIGKPAGPGLNRDPFAPVWKQEAIDQLQAGGTLFSLKEGKPVSVNEFGDILDDNGTVVIKAPPGVDGDSYIVTSGENIERVNSLGATRALYGVVTSTTVVNFYTDDTLDAMGRTIKTEEWHEAYSNVKQVNP